MKERKAIKHMLKISIYVLIGLTICIPSLVLAHPASDLTLNYDNESQLLHVVITHQVSDPQSHYIYTTVIRVNDEVYESYNYSSQPTNSSFTYTYDVDVSIGDEIEVFTDCNLGGSLTSQIMITEDGMIIEDSTISFQEISYYSIFGIPFIVHLGIVTLFMFIVTAGLGLLKRRGKTKISWKWHFRLAYISISLGIIHGLLGLVVYI